MEFEHPFVQEVRANPHDDSPRLIFADYLEEAGDLRGELIRVQVELSHLPPGDPARRELELRESELLENADEWLAPLTELGAEGMSARCFQRGLIERVRISAEAFLKHGEELCRQAPALYCLELRTGGDLSALSRVCAKPLPAQVTALDLSANKLAASDIALLAASDWPRQLEDLTLAFNQLDDAAMAALGHWPVLTGLNLSVNRIGPAGIDALLRRPAVPQLSSLVLSVNQVGDVGLTQLAQSVLAGQIRRLDLAKAGISFAGINRTVSSPLWQGMERLILRGNSLGEGFDRAIGVFLSAPRLTHLDLRGTVATTGRYGYGTTAPPGPPAELVQKLGDGLIW
jgi:uncharacterized protein (TIGR02996 family)